MRKSDSSTRTTDKLAYPGGCYLWPVRIAWLDVLAARTGHVRVARTHRRRPNTSAGIRARAGPDDRSTARTTAAGDTGDDPGTPVIAIETATVVTTTV